MGDVTLCQRDGCGYLLLIAKKIERTLSASRGGKRIDVNSWEFSSGISVGGQYKVSRNIFFYIEPGLNWYMNKNHNVPTLRSESPVYLNMKGGIRLSY